MVVIGGGLTFASAAETLRPQGSRGPIVVLSDERYLPFECLNTSHADVNPNLLADDDTPLDAVTPAAA